HIPHQVVCKMGIEPQSPALQADSLPSEPIGKPSIYHRPLKVKECSSVQLLGPVQLFVTPWTAACQASLSITNYQSLLRIILCFFQPGVCHDPQSASVLVFADCIELLPLWFHCPLLRQSHSFFCFEGDKRGNLQEHERSALWDHMLLVLEKNFQLEEQISDLHKSLEQKEIKIQQLAETVKKFEKEFKQFAQLFGKTGSFLSNMQVLATHIDKSAWLKVQQQSKFDLRPLVEAIDTVKQKITLLETNDQRLVVLEGETNKHDAHINIHKAQLNKNEERFKLLESACYNRKLIWKVTDYKLKKEALDGHTVSIFSQPFYTSRCGYREFDSLLQWPFRQRVTLMLLDQSGKKNHIMETFKADPNSSSFKRPDGEMNIATGCPRFVAHSTLENAKNTHIKDDTLFLKMAVDLSDLEDL
ncbi:hypothetical protein FD754_003619, partial [Muntiacus muntjak]